MSGEADETTTETEAKKDDVTAVGGRYTEDGNDRGLIENEGTRARVYADGCGRAGQGAKSATKARDGGGKYSKDNGTRGRTAIRQWEDDLRVGRV